jgi:hypothetical protein
MYGGFSEVHHIAYNVRYEFSGLYRCVEIIKCKKRHDTSLKELYQNLFLLTQAVVSCISTGDTKIPLAVAVKIDLKVLSFCLRRLIALCRLVAKGRFRTELSETPECGGSKNFSGRWCHVIRLKFCQRFGGTY